MGEHSMYAADDVSPFVLPVRMKKGIPTHAFVNLYKQKPVGAAAVHFLRQIQTQTDKASECQWPTWHDMTVSTSLLSWGAGPGHSTSSFSICFCLQPFRCTAGLYACIVHGVRMEYTCVSTKVSTWPQTPCACNLGQMTAMCWATGSRLTPVHVRC